MNCVKKMLVSTILLFIFVRLTISDATSVTDNRGNISPSPTHLDLSTSPAPSTITTWSYTKSATKRKKVKISLKGLSMIEICAKFRKFGENCTCENLPKGLCEHIQKHNTSSTTEPETVFHCNTKWNRLAAGLALFASIIGIIGNGLVIIMTIKFWKASTRHQILIGALAVADFTFAFPQIMLQTPKIWTCHWIYKLGLCKFIQGFNNWCGHVALGIILIIAFERYLGVVRPFSRGLKTISLGLLMFMNVVVATASVAPMVIVLKLDEFDMCIEKWPASYSSLVYSWYLTIFYFIIPIIIISFLYYSIMSTLRAATYKNRNSTAMDEAWRKNRRKENERIMIILIAIFVAFFVLVLPNRLIWLVMDHVGINNLSYEVYYALKLTGLIPYFFHVAINPIIYSVIDRKFREKISILFSCNKKIFHFSFRPSTFGSTKKVDAGSTLTLRDVSVATKEGIALL